MNEFRQSWLRDYLLELAAPTFAGKGIPLTDVLQEGQVVLVREEASLKKGKWILARITKITMGRDGNPRRIHLISGGRPFTRHIDHIALIEGSPFLRDQQEFWEGSTRKADTSGPTKKSRRSARNAKKKAAKKAASAVADGESESRSEEKVEISDQSPKRSSAGKKKVRFAE